MKKLGSSIRSALATGKMVTNSWQWFRGSRARLWYSEWGSKIRKQRSIIRASGSRIPGGDLGIPAWRHVRHDWLFLVTKSVDVLAASMHMTQSQHKTSNLKKTTKSLNVAIRSKWCFWYKNILIFLRRAWIWHSRNTRSQIWKKSNHLALRFGADNASGQKIYWFPCCEHEDDTIATQILKSEQKK